MKFRKGRVSAEYGRRGGRATTDKKVAASRRNAEKARQELAARRSVVARQLSALDEVEQLQLASPTPPPMVTKPAPQEMPDTSATAPDEATCSPPPAARPATTAAAVHDGNRLAWLQWPAEPIIRSQFEIEARALHRLFNPGCRCRFCA
jgi:hypothetical protein